MFDLGVFTSTADMGKLLGSRGEIKNLKCDAAEHHARFKTLFDRLTATEKQFHNLWHKSDVTCQHQLLWYRSCTVLMLLSANVSTHAEVCAVSHS